MFGGGGGRSGSVRIGVWLSSGELLSKNSIPSDDCTLMLMSYLV